MKKIFCVFFSVIFLSLCVLVPVSASSSSSFAPDYLNSNPSFQVFSRNDNSNNFLVDSDDYVDFEVDVDGSYSLTIFLFCLDINYIPVDRFSVVSSVNSLSLNGSVSSSRSGSFYIYMPKSFYYDDRRGYLDLQFYVDDPSVAFIALIPLSSPLDETIGLESANYINSYLRSIPGYTLGYSDGLRDGKIDGYNSVDQNAIRQQGFDKGFQEGYDEGKEYGISISDPDEMLPAITDATLQVVSSPFQAITNALNFSVFGVNIASLFFTIITLLVVGFILKHFI